MDTENLVILATRARQRGDHSEAGRLLEQARRAAPADPLILNALGMHELASGNPDGAIRHFEGAIEADPREPALWMNLAGAHRSRGDDAGERLALEGVLAIDQTHFLGQIRIADLHERTGKMALAANHWRAALSLAPPDAQLPPALVQRLAEARAFVAGCTRELTSSVDEGLAAARRGLPPGESRRFDAAVDLAFGRRAQVFANECSGLHFPFLPADEFFDRAHFSWMAELETRWEAIRDEFLALHADPADSIRPYVRQEKGTPLNKWTPLDNHLDWGAYFLWEYGQLNPGVAERCPVTVSEIGRAHV